MKNKSYKMIIYGNNIYREQVLTTEESEIIKIGTTKNCQIRFNKDKFFSEFEISLVKVGALWRVISDEQVYFTTDGVMKIYSKDLEHGDEITVKYRNINGELFKFNLFINFDDIEKNYDRLIDISEKKKLLIGGNDKCEISIQDPLLGKDYVTIEKNGEGWLITDNNTRYGVYVNGQKINGYCKLRSYDFFMIVGYSFYLKDNKLYTSNCDEISLTSLNFEDLDIHTSSYRYPKFNRNTRIKYEIPSEEIEILQPSPKIQKQRSNILLTLAPAIGMLFVTVILRGMMGGNGSFVLFSGASVLIGISVSIATFIIEKRKYKKDVKERKEKYLEYIARKESEVLALRENELSILNKIYSPLEFNIKNALEFNKYLFERDLKDDDFLSVRVGTGEIPACCPVKYSKQEFKDTEDELIDLPEQLENKYHNLQAAPIISKLSQSDAIGIVGNKENLYGLLKNITLDLVTRHFYKDVKFFYIFDIAYSRKFSWIRWLHHVNNDVLGLRNLIYDEDSKNTILEFLYIELSKRENEKKQNREYKANTNYVIFVFDKKGIEKHPISQYFEICNELGFTFMFFEENEDMLPKGCTEVVRLDNNNMTGKVLISNNGQNIREFNYKEVPDVMAEQVALKLSSVFVDEVSLESELTKNITLFELIGIMSVDDLDVETRWNNSKVYKSLAAPLGVKTNNKIVYLDLNEKYHGPHGLVAGTTGSGKSEILQTYILSMASLYHPYEVGFVIIDFKGGGMVNQFKELPHLVGAITNIDGREINRSLLSIKAELRRRQEVFSDYNVNHIDSYIKLYKEGKSQLPLPHLIIIVDEFAELKSEYPDFMKELISAARIGRSLGVHLILATQKPSGVVDNQIWSNSKFKLCLKVQTKEDSNEVIKTPLAAEIVEPGRAYFQVGNNEIFELFQSAYSGAKVPNLIGEINNEFEIHELNLWGKRKLIYSNKVKKEEKDGKNQLEAVVEYIKDFCESKAISRLPGICLPALPDVIYLDELKSQTARVDEGIIVSIGRYDDPEQQLQEDINLNISQYNTYVIGSSQSGKTILLQTLLFSIMERYTPSEVNVYIIDCGNMALKTFENANHVGGVVIPSEEEKMHNLFKLLAGEINRRKNAFLNMGLGTYKSYVEVGYKDIPQIILVIDNIAAFKEYYPNFDEVLLNLSREGQSVGINIIITATQTNSIGYKMLANFGNRIALNCTDKNEYSNLFDRCRIEPKSNAGRGLFIQEKRILEFQTALCVKGEKEIKRTENMKKFIENIQSVYKYTKAKRIPLVPEVLRSSEMYTDYKNEFKQPYMMPIGIDYSSIEFKHLDLQTIGMFAITGREKSGKTNFIKYLMSAINKNIFSSLTEAYIIDSTDHKLESISNYGFVKKYTIDTEDISFMFESIVSELEERQQAIISNRTNISETEILKQYPLLLVLIENAEFIDLLTKDKNLNALFAKMTKQLKNLKIAVIFTNIENVAAGYNAPEMIKLIKENKKAIIFEDINNIKLFETNIKQQKEFNKPIKSGDGYLLINGEYEKIKTVLET